MGATNTLYFCLNTQQALDNAVDASSNPKFGQQETLGTLKAVLSPENRQGFEFEYNTPRARPTSSSNRKVTIYGNPKNCATVSTTSMDLCTGTTAETTDLIDDELQVNNERWIGRTYDRTVYRDVCDTPDGRAAQKVAENLLYDAYQILKRENDDLITAILADRDTYFDGTASSGATEKDIPLYSSTAPIVPQPGNMYIILNEYERLGYSATPFIVGGTTLGRWVYDSNFYSMDTSATGRDITKMPPPIPTTYVDYQVDANFADGASHLLTWIPGHIQMLHWNDYAPNSPLARTNDEITKTVITIDVPGFGPQQFDYVVYDNNCDEEVDVKLRRFSETWVIPSGFFAGAYCGGMQSVLGWGITCADTTCANIQRPGNIIT